MLAQGRGRTVGGWGGGQRDWKNRAEPGRCWVVKYWPDWRAPRTTFSSDAFASTATDDNEDDYYYFYFYYCYCHYYYYYYYSYYCPGWARSLHSILSLFFSLALSFLLRFLSLSLLFLSPRLSLFTRGFFSLPRPFHASCFHSSRPMATVRASETFNFSSPLGISPCRDASCIFFIDVANSGANGGVKKIINFVLRRH